jgi:hypothetical protein
MQSFVFTRWAVQKSSFFTRKSLYYFASTRCVSKWISPPVHSPMQGFWQKIMNTALILTQFYSKIVSRSLSVSTENRDKSKETKLKHVAAVCLLII